MDVKTEAVKTAQFSLREVLLGTIPDIELAGALEELLNPDVATLRELGDKTFAEVVDSLDQMAMLDLTEFGITNTEEVIRCMNRLKFDLMDSVKEEKRERFVTNYSNFSKLLFSCFFFPDLYGTQWGLLENRTEASTEDYSWDDFLGVLKVNEIESFEQSESVLREVALTRTERNLRRTITVGTILAELGNQVQAVLPFLQQLPPDLTWFDLNVFLNKFVFEPADSVVELTDENTGLTLKMTFKERSKLFGVVGGKLNAYVKALVVSLAPDEFEKLRNEFAAGYFFEKPETNGVSQDDNVLDREDKELIIAKAGKFMPKRRERGASESRLVLMETKDLIDAAKKAILRTEGRYVGQEYLNVSFFEQFRHSPFPRLVPNGQGEALVALSSEQSQLYDVDFENPPVGYTVMKNQKLFFAQTGRDTEELNRRINYCLENNEELVIFVPTCPADTHSLVGDNQVAFTKGEIVGNAVSWTCLNTTDGLALLLQELSKVGVRTHVVYATGDMEFPSGNTRNMSEQAFFGALDQNHQTIANLMTMRLGGRMNNVQYEDSASYLRARRSEGLLNDTVAVDVDGVMNIAFKNGINWFELKEDLRPVVEDFFDNTANDKEINKVVMARTKYYIMRISLSEGLSDEEAAQLITPERLRTELMVDVLDYCAFHTMAKMVWGTQRMFVLAGDSHPLEDLAAKIVGNFLISVEGNYAGSKYLETDAA